jgi:hypothetical protein
MPVGGLLGGVLGSTIGIRTTLLVAAVGQSLAFLWVFFSPLRSLREASTSPDQDTAPAVRLPTCGQSDGTRVRWSWRAWFLLCVMNTNRPFVSGAAVKTTAQVVPEMLIASGSRVS